MIIAIFSDVHANLPALEKFIDVTKDIADAYICLGDVVNYGPWNDECLELVHSLPGIVFLEGNHERLFLETGSVIDEIPLVQEFYRHSIKYFSRKDLISGLAIFSQVGPFNCAHSINNRKIYSDTAIELRENYFIGHTHHQYKIRRSGNVIVNCGSIGQNRRGIDIINYVLYDTYSGGITLCKEYYPVDKFLSELWTRGYSQPCIDYYLSRRKLLTE